MGVKLFIKNHLKYKTWTIDVRGNIDFYDVIEPLNDRAYLLLRPRKEYQLFKGVSWPKNDQFTEIKPNYPDFKWMKK
jgi:hypothetical protein